MGWDVLRRVIDLLHIVVLILLLTIMFLNNKSSENVSSFSLKVESLKDDMVKVITNNTSYLETRVNRAEEKQDNYQNTTSNQISLLSKRVEKLEQGVKGGTKIINTNNNVNTINGLPVSPN